MVKEKLTFKSYILQAKLSLTLLVWTAAMIVGTIIGAFSEE